jgi:hypothetical protein
MLMYMLYVVVERVVSGSRLQSNKGMRIVK